VARVVDVWVLYPFDMGFDRFLTGVYGKTVGRVLRCVSIYIGLQKNNNRFK
jgi:hypothetical protein